MRDAALLHPDLDVPTVPALRAVPPAMPPAPQRQLHVPAYERAESLQLQEELGIGSVLAEVLARRGLADPARARAFLAAQERHDPGRFAGIDRAVELIRRHLAAGSRIIVHGDYDVDGVCATAITVRALRALGGDVRWFLPDRREDGYGLSSATVQRLAQRGAALLITVDCGITAVEEVGEAIAAGLDVVITDHHSPRPDGVLPACPVVHPRVGGYPCADLCGTAVAFKLAEALDAPGLDGELELVALATVADLMPLQGENRRLVREGVAAMANTVRPGLRALMSTSRTDPSELDATVLGFRLAPRINAAGRMRRADAGLELLLTEDPERAREIAEELEGVNAGRREVEQQILWQAQAQAEELGERSAYVLWNEQWHPGVIGIVASRIVERFHRPTILISLDEHDTGQGSGRSIPGFDLLRGLEATAGHLLRFGGHRAAAGLALSSTELDCFRAAFEEHASEVLTAELLSPVEQIDGIVCASQLGLELIEELAQLEPCGAGNPRPRLLVPGARIGDLRPMGDGRHARFSVASGGARARAVAFGCDGRVTGSDGEPVDATFALERNVWNGAVEARLLLRHARPCAPPPIDVLAPSHSYLQIALGELDEPQPQPAHREPCLRPPGRVVLDRRWISPLTTLTDALSAGGDVLAVCADLGRRLPGLADLTGGFTLTSWQALEGMPGEAAGFRQLVALDPPAERGWAALLRAGGESDFALLAWGEAELRFAQQMHEHEHDLRAALAGFYRRLKLLGTATGEELERALRGEGRHPRSPRLAGRLLRVLAELELIAIDRSQPAVQLVSAAPTSLERSPAYRVYRQRYEDGLRFLSHGSLPQLA